MLRFHPTLPAFGLMLAAAALPAAAMAQTAAAAGTMPTPSPPSAPAGTAPAPVPAPMPAAVPPGLVGAWGSDSSCTDDVAIFRADGTVLNPAAPAGTPPLTFSVDGNTITLTEGGQSGVFAFALSDQAVAWSNGSAIELKERCADQSPFAALLKTAALPQTPNAPPPAASIPAAPLPDQIRALAGLPVPFQGQMVEIRSVRAETAQPYTGFVARPDPAEIAGDARLFYRIFPTPAAAGDYVSGHTDSPASFAYEPHGGFFTTAAAVDEGPGDTKATPIPISCLRFHPEHRLRVTISCFAAMPGTRLVAGGQKAFPLPEDATAKNTGSGQDLSQTLTLTGLAISQLRAFLAAHPQP